MRKGARQKKTNIMLPPRRDEREESGRTSGQEYYSNIFFASLAPSGFNCFAFPRNSMISR